ncbi:MAG TPA: protein kinase [Phycisphaerales bacterium]|nr:protein kinase [Phycisphaerales bacterium]HMP37788.1 protein kinase [Phycisphaerales bacterium]
MADRAEQAELDERADSTQPVNRRHWRPTQGAAQPEFPAVARRAYELICHLGRGGTVDVYKARRSSASRIVAVKVLRPELAQSPVMREQMLAAAANVEDLRHVEHIERLETTLESPEHGPILVMEFIEGESLASVLGRGPLPLDEALRLATEISVALFGMHDHARKFLHGDVTPANIMRRSDGTFTLIDLGFGLSRWKPAPDRDAWVKVEQVPLGGTRRYMAPEQAGGDEPIDARADIYSLGCVLFEAVTGVPWAGTTRDAAALARIPGRAPRPLRKAIERMVVPERARRLQTLGQLPADLGERRHQKRHPGERVLPRTPKVAAFDREGEIEVILARVGPGAVHQIVGPAGVGTTTVARAIAWRVAEGTYPFASEGVGWIDCGAFGPATTEDDLAVAVAAALRASGSAGVLRSIDRIDAERLAATAGRRAWLLIFDGIDRCADAFARLGRRLADQGRCCALATTTHAIGHFGSTRIGGLSTVAADRPSAAELFLRREALRLGVSLPVDGPTTSVLAQIVALLGGNPGAITLVAREFFVLSPMEVLERLRHSDDPGAVAQLAERWIDDLDERDRDLLASLSVFQTPVTAKDIASLGATDVVPVAGVRSPDGMAGVTGALLRLVPAQLVDRGVMPPLDQPSPHAEMAGARDIGCAKEETAAIAVPRFAIRHLLRPWARRHLGDRRWDALHARHLRWVIEQCDALPYDGDEQLRIEGYDRVEAMHPEIDQALRYADSIGDGAAIAAIVVHAGRVWLFRGPAERARRWFPAARPATAKDRLTFALLCGHLDLLGGEWNGADAQFRAALAIAEEIDPARRDRARLRAMINVAVALQRRGGADSLGEALSVEQDAIRIAEERGFESLASHLRMNMASTLLLLDRLDEAEELLRPLLLRLETEAPEKTSPQRISYVHQLLGSIALLRGDLANARRCIGRALRLNRAQVGNREDQLELALITAAIEAREGDRWRAGHLARGVELWSRRLCIVPLPLHHRLLQLVGTVSERVRSDWSFEDLVRAAQESYEGA